MANLKTMDVEALLKLRADVDDQLAQRRTQLRKELARLEGLKPDNGQAVKVHGAKGRKVPPKYQSKKDPKLTWAGRGATPIWMRQEIKGTKLKKDAFLIKP